MVVTFLYLTACSIKNSLRRRAKRLREPRYLVGLIVGLAYLYLMLFRRGARSSWMNRGPSMAVMAKVTGPIQLIGSLFLLVVAAVSWALPGVGRPITFSRAEVHFLFTAPLTRRQLLHYKLLRSQIGILASSAIMTLVRRPSSAASAWTFLVGLWLLLMTLRLHLMGVALSRSSLAQHGRAGIARQWLPVAVVVGALSILADTVIRDWPVLSSLSDFGTVFNELQRLMTTGAAGVVLWPFRALTRPLLAASPAEFWAVLPPVIVLLALNYMWVLRADAGFEESSAAHAERQARNVRAPRPVGRGPVSTPFRLAPDGPPETAILWKNLIQLGRYVSLRTLLRLLPLVVIFAVAAQGGSSGHVGSVLAAVLLPAGILTILFGPQAMRNDLRRDLANLAILKTWPVRGAALLRGEILAPTAVLTIISWLIILTSLAVSTKVLFPGSSVLGRIPYGLAAAMLAPALILAQVGMQNALAVLFPAWAAIGASRARGIDAMGQRLLMLAGLMVTLALSLVPGAAVAAGLAVLVYWLTGKILIVLPALIIMLVVFAECWLAVEGLGRVLDRTDATAVDAAE
jgi:ABC-2 type transport system permease protein